MLGSAAESLAVVSWKDQSLQSCNIHESFQCFGDANLYPGWIRVCVSCCSDVIELFLSCCFVAVLLLPFSR